MLFTKEPPRSVKQARHVSEEHTGIRRGLTQVRHFLHRLKMAPRKVAALPIPPKSTLPEHVQAQAEFLEKKREPRLQERGRGSDDCSSWTRRTSCMPPSWVSSGVWRGGASVPPRAGNALMGSRRWMR